MDEAQWQTIPGYTPLVRRLLIELKAQHGMHDPEALLRCARAGAARRPRDGGWRC
jgi:hypothetical protein